MDPDAGAAYLLDWRTGEVVQTWRSPEPDTGRGYGNVVVLDGTTAYVSEPFGVAAGGMSLTGRLMVYDTLTGATIKEFNEGIGFGSAIATDATRLIVGNSYVAKDWSRSVTRPAARCCTRSPARTRWLSDALRRGARARGNRLLVGAPGTRRRSPSGATPTSSTCRR